MSRTMNNLKESWKYIENEDSDTLYVCKVCCLKKTYNKPPINLDRLVIAGKYQTSVFYVLSIPRSDIFP